MIMNEENHKGWKLVSGVRRDVINLFKLFANTNSIRFEDFSKVWKDTNFSLIFRNRNSYIELLELSEEILQIVKEHLFSVYEFHTRVAAVYALYGLYFKQPILGAAKIRFTKTEWEEVFPFIMKAKEEKHYDVAFTFLKLYMSEAFSFTATVRPTGLERGFRKYWEKRSSLHSKVCDVELLYRPLINEKLVNSLIKLESLYCRKKSELLGRKNLVFIDGEFAKSLQGELKKYELASQTQYSVKNKICGTANETDIENHVASNDQLGSKRKQTSISSKGIDDEIVKKIKFNRQHMKMMAKKKAEFYIRKLNLENSEQESTEKKSKITLSALE